MRELNKICWKCIKLEDLVITTPQLLDIYTGCDMCGDKKVKSYDKDAIIDQEIEARR